MLGLALPDPFRPETVDVVSMGTTVATNALLERKGDRTVLVITRGFADALRIGYQHRPKLFVRHIELPSMLYEEVIEVDERLGAHGELVRAPELHGAEQALRAAFARGIRACAIVLMHGYRYPQHERQLEELAQSVGYTQISVSHRVSPLMKLVSRGDTTVVDAYLSPVLRRYVDQVAAAAPRRTTAIHAVLGRTRGRAAISGQGRDPLGSGRRHRRRRTHGAGSRASRSSSASTWVARRPTWRTYAGEYERAFDTEVAGVRLRAPLMQIHTVAAGGGSICHFDGVRLRVGPDSAGADPGPAAIDAAVR